MLPLGRSALRAWGERQSAVERATAIVMKAVAHSATTCLGVIMGQVQCGIGRECAINVHRRRSDQFHVCSGCFAGQPQRGLLDTRGMVEGHSLHREVTLLLPVTPRCQQSGAVWSRKAF